MSPVKVTLTPSKENEGEAEPTEEILALETDEEEEEEEKTETEKKVAHPQLWEKCLVMTEQPDEYDSGEDPEYIPPPVILDTSFEYDEVSSCTWLYCDLKLTFPYLVHRGGGDHLRQRGGAPEG